MQKNIDQDAKTIERYKVMFVAIIILSLIGIGYALSILDQATADRPRAIESVEQRLHRSPPQLTQFHQEISAIFADKLPILTGKNLEYIHLKFFRIHFNIPTSTLSTDDFQNIILKNFTQHGWQITHKSDHAIRLVSAQNYCEISFSTPKQFGWDVSCFAQYKKRK